MAIEWSVIHPGGDWAWPLFGRKLLKGSDINSTSPHLQASSCRPLSCPCGAQQRGATLRHLGADAAQGSSPGQSGGNRDLETSPDLLGCLHTMSEAHSTRSLTFSSSADPHVGNEWNLFGHPANQPSVVCTLSTNAGYPLSFRLGNMLS